MRQNSYETKFLLAIFYICLRYFFNAQFKKKLRNKFDNNDSAHSNGE